MVFEPSDALITNAFLSSNFISSSSRCDERKPATKVTMFAYKRNELWRILMTLKRNIELVLCVTMEMLKDLKDDMQETQGGDAVVEVEITFTQAINHPILSRFLKAYETT